MERKIGEVFEWNHDGEKVWLECVEGNGCGMCYCNEVCECGEKHDVGHCSPRLRSDNTSVIFRKVDAPVRESAEKAEARAAIAEMTAENQRLGLCDDPPGQRRCGTCGWWEPEALIARDNGDGTTSRHCEWEPLVMPYAEWDRLVRSDNGTTCPTWKPVALKQQDCPWCGGDVEMMNVLGEHYARCLSLWCMARGPIAEDKGEAIRQWNRVRLDEC